MTDEDIIRMAGEALGAPYSSYLEKRRWDISDKQLKRFAALVAATEREACAQVCDSLHDNIYLVEKTEHYPGEYGSEYDAGQGNAISECAAAIRTRSNE